MHISRKSFTREGLLQEYARLAESQDSSFAFVFGYLFCVAAHVFYLIMFSLMHATELVWFNCFSVPFYLVLMFIGGNPKTQDFWVYASTFEIIIHATLATFLLGWEPGFNIFLLMVIPTSFFMPNKRLYMPYVVSVAALGAYGLLSHFVGNTGIVKYPAPEDWMLPAIYMVNVAMGICTMLYSSTIYMIHGEYLKYQLELQNKKLQNLALCDPLTQLYNRRSMDEYLMELQKQCQETGQHYAAAICDVDNFKKVNDTYGHAVGDEVLVYVAQCFKELLPQECHPARWGGEEFLFVLPNAGVTEAAVLSEKLHEALRGHTFTTKKGDLQVTMTIGIASGSGADEIEKVVTAADTQLYIGKNNGKNHTEYQGRL